MTKTFLLALAILSGDSLMADQYVSGYTKSNGTYVEGHYRSSPNSTTYDNYSTKGNTNPYTGEKGYKNPESSSNNNYNNSYSYGSNKKSF